MGQRCALGSAAAVQPWQRPRAFVLCRADINTNCCCPAVALQTRSIENQENTVSQNRISSRQVDSGTLAWSQRRVGDGIWWDGDGAYGIHSWKSTELQAGTGLPAAGTATATTGRAACGAAESPAAGAVDARRSGVHPFPQHPPRCRDPPQRQ